MAVIVLGTSVLSLPITVIGGDTVGKPDVAASVAKQWYEQGVNAIVDLPLSPVAKTGRLKRDDFK